MASNQSRTITTEQARKKCRSIILKLTQPSKNSAENTPQRMLSDLQIRVNNRFNILVTKLVINEKEQINDALLEKLQKVDDPDAFLETFLTHLYGRAVKEEDDALSHNVCENEKNEIDAMVEEQYKKGKNNEFKKK